MNRLVLGVMGHVDHGKTALVRALTGVDTDRLAEEKRRGISIALGFAHLEVEGAVIDLVDMPGHERFVRTMAAGAAGMQAALVVIAANEGIKPQTEEHLQIAAHLGVRRVLPVIAKADIAGPDDISRCGSGVADLFARLGLEPARPVAVSALTGEGLPALHLALAGLVRTEASAAEDDGFPWLPVDRAFTLSGHGMVVTGTLRRGALTPEMVLTTPGLDGSFRIRGLQVHGRAVDRAEPGQRVAVNLRGAAAGELARGSVLTRPRLAAPSDWLDVAIEGSTDAPPLKSGARLTLLIGAAEAAVRLRLLDREALASGSRGPAQLHCVAPLVALSRERFILRTVSPPATVAGGVVLDPDAQRRRRHDADVLGRLSRLAASSPSEVVAGELTAAGGQGASFARLARLAGLAPERAAAAAADAGALTLDGGLLVGVAAMAAARAAVMRRVASDPQAAATGVSLRRLQTLSPELSPAVLDAVVSALVAAGRLRRDGARVRPALPPADVEAETSRQAALAARLAEAFRRAGLTPPDPETAAPTPAARRALDGLARTGVIVRTFDRVQKREVLFHRDAVEAAKSALAPQLAAPGLRVGEAGAALGVSRKYSVPLLEYLDTARFTKRLGDRRVLGPGS